MAIVGLTRLRSRFLHNVADNLNVIVTSPTWLLSGVNVFAANLVHGLQATGAQASILLTDPEQLDPYLMPLPADIPVEKLQISHRTSWRARWRTMIRYLEERAPCIYIPNYDFRYSCISPKLSSRIGIVCIIHSDEPVHYEHAIRLGKYWNAIVAVSSAIAERAATLAPTLASRLVTISHGVGVSPRFPERQWDKKLPLKIVYVGRLTQYQKQVLGIPQVVAALVARNIPVKLTVIGDGKDRQKLVNACAGILGGVEFLGMIPNSRVTEILRQSDVFILPSEFEGLPVSLLEAMGWGCVPVVTDIRSGIPELVQDGVNGFRVGVGDIEGFVERLALLQRQPSLRRQMASRAYHTIRDGEYRVEDMVQRYLALFERILREAERGDYCRPRGRIVPPPSLRAEVFWETWLTPPGRRFAREAKRILQQVLSKGKVPTH